MKRIVASLAAVALLPLAGCDYDGAASLPLPGGAGGGGYEITMVFDDVTNLVPQETCRANDVVVGSVTSIELRDDLQATVVCRIDPEVQLAGNAVAVLRETSLLGERFVALDPPAGTPATGTLAPGSTIEQADTHVVPDVEVVFGALSAVLNGGGLQQVEIISRELSTALSESDLGGTTRKLDGLVGTLDDHKDDIVAALESVDRLAGVLADQRRVIADALGAVPQGLAVLERQRPRLVRTVQALGDLSATAVPLIRRSKADTVADLRHLAPVLEQLANSKERLAQALEAVVTFPFPSYTKYVAQGDYAGMFATITFDLDSFNHLLEQAPDPTGTPIPPLPADVPDVPDLPGVPDLPDDLPLEDLLDLLPDLELPETGLPGVPDLPGTIGGTLNPQHPSTLDELLTGGGR